MKIGIVLDNDLSWVIKDGILFVDCKDGNYYSPETNCIQAINILTCDQASENAPMRDLKVLRVSINGVLRLE